MPFRLRSCRVVRALPVAALVLASAFSTSAYAWNAAGHRLTAAIAWSLLSPEVRGEVEMLLASHPEAAKWRDKGRDTAPGALFAEAAVWPDELRKSATTRADAEDTGVHRDWHYVNWPLGQARIATDGGELAHQLATLPAQLSDRRLSATERSVALAWLIHLVGDAHAPLHAATWRGEDGAWSLGGNRFPVIDPFNPRQAETNLHRYWDDLPGPPWLRGRRLERRAEALQSRFPAASIDQADIEQWLAESHRWVRLAVLPPGSRTLTIDPAYREQAAAVVDRRIAEAGTRLGRWLEVLLRQ